MTETERLLRDRIARMEEENRWLRDMLAPPGFLPSIFKLTTHEERAFKALLARDEWTREALLASVYLVSNERDIPDIRVVDGLVYKIRRKVNPLGIEIETLYGNGFRINSAGRRRARDIVAAERDRERAEAEEIRRRPPIKEQSSSY